MNALPNGIREDFPKFFSASKTSARFSAIPLHQVHEQEASGGAVGLTENPTAFKRWMVAGPEQARLITLFEREYLPEPEPETNYHHHEESLPIQVRFQRQMNNLISQFKDCGNSFEEACPELLVLHTRE